MKIKINKYIRAFRISIIKEKDLLNDSKEKGTIEMINSSNKQELIDLSWKLIEM